MVVSSVHVMRDRRYRSSVEKKRSGTSSPGRARRRRRHQRNAQAPGVFAGGEPGLPAGGASQVKRRKADGGDLGVCPKHWQGGRYGGG